MNTRAPIRNPLHPSSQPVENIMAMQNELSADGLFKLGFWMQGLEEFERAAACYEKVIKDAPDFFQAFFNLGVIHYQQAKLNEAVAYLEKAIQIKPDLAEAWSALGIIRCDQSRFDEAIVCLDQALTVNPDLTAAHYHMGVALQQNGHYQEGLASYQKAMQCDPGFAPARWLSLLSLPIIYDTAAQIDEYRRQFTTNLGELIQTPLETAHQKRYALEGINACTNFYLQYQGRNDLVLQSRYGDFVHRIMVANYPQWTQPKPMPPWKPGEKIRIGYVSSFMFAHTVGVFLSGWVENQNQSRFEIHTYHMGNKIDALTAHIQRHSHAFHCFGVNVTAAARQIEADRLHILVYTDIGMNTETLQLAALRLAPVQCKGWGHPVTTGLPTMDYYLSSDLMEPPHGEQHYSETVVRLPNLALCYRRRKLPQEPKTRGQLGLPPNRFIYLTTQSLFKYLPQHDDIYPRIALQVPRACFVFIANQSAKITDRFYQRLGSAFQRHGLEADHFCRILPRLNGNDFMALNLSSNVLLDTLEWSGGKTTLEALDCGLPVLTCPGGFMRGRHAYAMLKMINLTATIAKDKDAYCDIAVKLGTDQNFYATVKQHLLEHREKLYGDKNFITGLEKFYQSVVQQSQRDGSHDAVCKGAAALKEAGHYRQAVQMYQKVVSQDPGNPGAFFDLGICLLKLGKFSEAIHALRQSTQLDDPNPLFWFHLAEAHFLNQTMDSAIACYQKAIQLKPEWDSAHYNIAVALRTEERLTEAINHLKQATRLNPDFSQAHAFLFRLAQHTCDWSLTRQMDQRLDELTPTELAQGRKCAESPITNIRRTTDVSLNGKVAQSWSRHVAQQVAAFAPQTSFAHIPSPHQPIRIGYLSNDFKDHAVAHQIRGLLEKHDRRQFEIFGYALNPDDGTPYRQRLSRVCDHFRELHQMSDPAAAQIIHGDHIQILVDLAGHSRNNRMGIAALRPAPIQVSYLGFLGTTGADFIDYVIADAVVVPEGDKRFYAEKVVHLPHCYQANDDQLPIAQHPYQRHELKLPDKGFIYCSFNQPYKIDAALFHTWLKILKQVDGSILWLVERSPLAKANLRRAAEKAQVNPDRLVFAGFLPLERNLARLQLADLVLDTRIYNGGATTANALWAGVPVLTILGNNWVSRMSASALAALDLPELITEDLNTYAQKAVRLAKNRSAMEALRNKLRAQRHTAPLFNTTLFTRHMEKAYTLMLERYEKNLAPESFSVHPL